MKTPIFVSAVTRELRQTRQLGANILTRLGYEPVWQDVFGTEGGDLRQMLRDKIDGCDGLVHVVGRAYGAEPPQPDPEFGRVSYTQYELLYARKRGKKTWIVFVEDGFPTDKPPEQLDLPVDGAHPDPSAYQAERRGLQDAWRQKLRGETNLWYAAATKMEFELIVERLKDELRGLRRSFRSWQRAVLGILFVLLLLGGGLYWLLFRQGDQVEQVKQGQDELLERAKRAEEQWKKIRPDDIKAQLIKTIEETFQKELKEAESLDTWEKRADAKKDAKEIRIKRLDRVTEFVESITSTIKAGQASPEFLEFTRIFQDQGPVEALKYIDAQEQRLLAEAEKLTQEKRKALAPLLKAAGVHVSRGEYPAARDKCEKILLKDGDWPEALEQHVQVLEELGDRAMLYDTTEVAAAMYQAMETSALRRADADPMSAQAERDLAISFSKLGSVYLRLGQTGDARDFYKKYNAIAQKLADADPKSAQAQRDLSVPLIKLGDVTLLLGETKDALNFYKKCSTILQKLADADPKSAQAQHDLAVSFEKLGDVYLRLGQTGDARDFYKKDNAIAQKLADADPKSAQAQRDLLVSFFKFGTVAEKIEDYAAAIGWFEKALVVAEKFEKPEFFAAEMKILKKQIGVCKEKRLKE